MSKDNPISGALTWWRENGPNPLLTAAMLGGLAYGKGRLFWGPAVETLRSLGRPFGKKMAGGERDWDYAMDELKSNSEYSKFVQKALGLLTAGTALAAFARPDRENMGLLKWNAPFKAGYNNIVNNGTSELYKTASYLTDSYMQDIDWMQPIDARQARALFTNDPAVQENAYVRNTGLAIVNNAALRGGTEHPTLGRLFDSALDKMETKLTVNGVTDIAVKSAVANTTARLFTGALGAVCGMNDRTRQKLIDAGTWAGAIAAILE